MPPRTRLALPHHRVVAVVVAHDGARWLPETLAALAAQTRAPQVTVAVDTGSTDGTGALLEQALGTDAIRRLPRASGFGTAVAAGLAHAVALGADAPLPRRRAADQDAPPPVGWIWVLHDDCAPEPDALRVLLDAAETMPSAAVLGPKVRDWDDPKLLVEVGLTVDRAGRRETGLERREYDQGQHDAVRDVLAVGSAGALLRRAVFAELGGFDPRLPLFRDDVDYGWRVNAAGHRVVVVPGAKVRHARAATLNKRPLSAAHGRAAGVDRRHSLAVLLANLPLLGMLTAAPRLLAGALLRTLGFLLTRQVHAAADEIRAVGWNLSHVGSLVAARRQRRGHRKAPRGAVKPLFAGRAERLRGYLEAFGDWLTGGGGAVVVGADGEEEIEPRRRERLLRARPGLGLAAGLLLVTAIALRGLVGGGSLVGGGLLPVPSAARDAWASYFASWHTVGPGSSSPASPALAVLGAFGWLLAGKSWLALDLLLLGCVPLAGLSAYLTSRYVVDNVGLRLWGAAAYAVLPVATGAVAAGRVDTAAAFVAAPPLLYAGARLLTRDPRYAGWRAPFATGLGLALAMAFAPQLWLLAAVPLLAGALAVLMSATPASRAGAARRGLAALLTVATPLAVLLPWSWHVLTDPVLLVSGAGGRTGVPGALPDAVDLLFLRAGGPGPGPAWLAAGLLAAALAGLARERRRRIAVGCWAVALVGYAFAVVVVRGPGDLPHGYPGPALALVAAALTAAALVAGEGARTRLAEYSFSWRQPLAAAVAAAAAAVPVLAAGDWVVRGAAGPLDRRPVQALPPAALSELRRAPGSRVLWLALDGGRVDYALTTAAGPRYGDGSLHVPGRTRAVLDGFVRDVASPRGTSAAEGLATFAVRYVAVR